MVSSSLRAHVHVTGEGEKSYSYLGGAAGRPKHKGLELADANIADGSLSLLFHQMLYGTLFAGNLLKCII